MKQGEQEVLHPRDRVGQTSGATQRCLILESARALGIRDAQETQQTLFSSARATMWPAARVNGVRPFNDAWLRTSLEEARRQAPRNGASILDAARELGIRDAHESAADYLHLTRSDVRRHATLPQSWIQRENWEFETHRALDRVEQIEAGGRIITRRFGQRVDTDHAGLIDAKVEFPPATSAAATVFRGGPLACPNDGQTRAVEHEMEALAGRDQSQTAPQMLTAPGERRIVGGGEGEAHHPEQCVQEPFGLAQREMGEGSRRAGIRAKLSVNLYVTAGALSGHRLALAVPVYQRAAARRPTGPWSWSGRRPLRRRLWTSGRPARGWGPPGS